MAFGQFVYYVLLEHHGSTKTALVTYLLPGMALVLGIVFLDEPLTVAAVAGLALVLPGVALGSGMLRPGRRRAARDRARAVNVGIPGARSSTMSTSWSSCSPTMRSSRSSRSSAHATRTACARRSSARCPSPKSSGGS